MMSGRLKEKIVIEHVDTTSTGSFGDESPKKSTNIPTRAEVQWGNGARRNINDEIVPYYDVTFITWIFLQDKISEGDKVTWRGRKYVIDSLQPVREQKVLYIKCLTS